jgi:hypothetical protein
VDERLVWYRVADPGRDHYLHKRPVPTTRPIFQGDIFEGIPLLFVRHPSNVGQERRIGGPQEPLLDPPAFKPDDIRGPSTKVKIGLGMVIPHICNYYETEAGRGSRVRVMALVRQQSKETLAEDWNSLFNLFPLPDLMGDGVMYFAQLDTLTTMEDAFLAKRARVASLSFEGWLALQQRTAHHFSRFAAKWDDLATLARPTWDQAARDEASAELAVAEPVSEGRSKPDQIEPA